MASKLHLSVESQNIILKVLEYFQKEKESGSTLLPVARAQERCAAAVGICTRTLRNVIERKTIKKYKRKRTSSKTTDLHDSTKSAVKCEIYNMYQSKEHVTLNSLMVRLQEKEILNVKYSSLRVILKNLSFRYSKSDNRRAL